MNSGSTMDKLKMHSPDLTQDNIARIRELFPGCVTEAVDKNGKLRLAVDFDQLRQELSGHVVDGPQERYHLDWPGKREALLAANAPIAKTLRPCREKSVDFDTTKNLFIEGDNLDALKLLQETYLSRVKLVYIDPPYNTGNQFIYDDDYSEDVDTYLQKSLQKTDGSERLVANLESNGRRHSNWLSLMLPRLRLARNLLADDGVILISIDDNEVSNLRKVCDEVFGSENFIATIVWQKRYVSNVTAKWLSDMHDFVLMYARNKDAVHLNPWERSDEQKLAYKNPDSDPRGDWRAQDLSASKPYMAGLFEITGPTGKKFSPPPGRYWRCNERQFQEWVSDARIWWGVNNDARPMLKSFLSESERGLTPHTWWTYDFAGHNKEATLELKALFDGRSPFDTPKPVRLMRRVLDLVTSKDSIVLDFFAGSGTLAHAVMEANAADRGSRRYILVQLDEACSAESEAKNFGLESISEISRERIKKAGVAIAKQNVGQAVDVGFRFLQIDVSNMADVYYSPDEVKQDLLAEHVDNIRYDRTPEDLLFQVLLDWGVDLSLPIRQEGIAGKTVFFVDDTALAACFDLGVDEAFVKTLAGYKPLRVVFRDSGFASDSVKINVEQLFKLLSPATEIKTI